MERFRHHCPRRAGRRAVERRRTDLANISEYFEVTLREEHTPHRRHDIGLFIATDVVYPQDLRRAGNRNALAGTIDRGGIAAFFP